MSNSLTFLPSCTHCSAIRAKGYWLKQDGSVAKTTQKLDLCSRCHFDRYCNATCQHAHWTAHKASCKASKSVAALVDKAVKDMFPKQPGRAVFSRDAKNAPSLTFISQSQRDVKESRLHVDVEVKGKVAGSYHYLLCKKVTLPEDLQKEFEEAKKVRPRVRDVPMVDLAKKIVDIALYDKAFEIIREWVINGFSKVVFFRYAAGKMIPSGISYEKIVQLAKEINLSKAKILNETVGIYAVHNLAFARKLASQSEKSHYYNEIIDAALYLENKRRQEKSSSSSSSSS